MKSRNREINVFSMSALDLFASALGAFILISIVLMPYFLRVEPEEVQRLKRALTEARDAHAEAERENARLQQELQALLDAPRFSFPDLDFVIALDTTTSMDNAAYPEWQAHAVSAARAFAARGPSHKVSTAFEYTDGSLGGTADFLRRLAESGNGNFTGSGGSFTSTMLFALAGL